ncbi:hypothetical protein WG907_04595 [Sphingobium sp. AN558]|uniref:hypothetical protein n=1 Tax=Sphingobium sp. AN558 TaxID=3133442 RepID=UPI0030C0CC9B
MPFWKPTPKITVAEHERIVAEVSESVSFVGCRVTYREGDNWLSDIYKHGRAIIREYRIMPDEEYRLIKPDALKWRKAAEQRRSRKQNAGKTPVGGE